MNDHDDNIKNNLSIRDERQLIEANDSNAWKNKLIRGKYDQPVPDSLSNIITTLCYYHKYKGVFVRNKFSDEIMVNKCPPWENEIDFKPHRLEDEDITLCSAALEHVHLKPTRQNTIAAIEQAARKNAIHPVHDYFERIRWDGLQRLHTWLHDYAAATEQPAEYLGPVGTKWMVAAVKRIYKPGTKFDHMLVLEGPPNIGKSRILRTLATIGPSVLGEGKPTEFFTDAIRFDTINEPASIIALQGKLIVEFSELSGMSRKEIEEVKNWITIERDVVQKKYKNEITEYARQFVLAGTTNEENYLRDVTGNRRFLPVKCGNKKFDIEGLIEVRDQLWAEAVHLYKSGFDTMIDHGSELEALAAAEQAQRLIEDPWTDLILNAVKGMRFVGINEVLQLIPLDPHRRDETSARRVAKVLRVAGWVKKQTKVDKINKKMWHNPDFDKQPN